MSLPHITTTAALLLPFAALLSFTGCKEPTKAAHICDADDDGDANHTLPAFQNRLWLANNCDYTSLAEHAITIDDLPVAGIRVEQRSYDPTPEFGANLIQNTLALFQNEPLTPSALPLRRACNEQVITVCFRPKPPPAGGVTWCLDDAIAEVEGNRIRFHCIMRLLPAFTERQQIVAMFAGCTTALPPGEYTIDTKIHPVRDIYFHHVYHGAYDNDFESWTRFEAKCELRSIHSPGANP